MVTKSSWLQANINTLDAVTIGFLITIKLLISNITLFAKVNKSVFNYQKNIQIFYKNKLKTLFLFHLHTNLMATHWEFPLKSKILYS